MEGLTNGGYPPSTLAAQIVDNLQHQYDTNNGLRPLLTNLVTAGGAAFNGTDVDTRCQLVDLLLRACRKLLCGPHVFESQTSGYEEAVSYLNVVHKTIHYTPDLLFYSYSPRLPNLPVSPHIPLFLWIIPQLIALLGEDQEAQIAPAIYTILEECQQIEIRSKLSKSSYRFVSTLIDSCIRDLLEHLLKLEKDASTTDNFKIPSDTSLRLAWPSIGIKEAQFVRIVLGGLARTVCISVRLIQVAALGRKSLEDDLQSHLDALNGGARLVSLLFRARQSLFLPSSNSQSYIGLLTIFRYLLRYFSSGPRLRRHLDLTIRSSCHLLSILFSFDLSLLGASLEVEICKSLQACLVFSSESLRSKYLFSFGLKKEVWPLIENGREWKKCGIDLQLSVYLTCSTIIGVDSTPASTFLHQFKNEEIKESFSVILKDANWKTSSDWAFASRSSKRVRTSREEADTMKASTCAQLVHELENVGIEVESVENQRLDQDAWVHFPLNETKKQERIIRMANDAIDALGDHTFSRPNGCKIPRPTSASESSVNQIFLDNIYNMLTYVLTGQQNQAPPIVTASRARTSALHCLHGILALTRNPSHLDLSSSQIGRWCIHCLKSKSKDIRMVAGRVIQQFIGFRQNPEICRRNRMHALDSVRQTSREVSSIQDETRIWILGQIAGGNPSEDETNVILFRLVEYLGNVHPLVSSLAFGELLRICANSSYRAQKLFGPYWGAIAIDVVKNIINKPSSIQRLADLIEMSVEDFLRITKLLTIPYLVLTRRKDVIERIVNAVALPDGPNATLFEICLGAEQLPSLLALLMIRAPSDHAEFITSMLSSISENFKSIDIVGLVKSDPVKIAFEIFRSAGDGEENQLEQTRSAIIFLSEQSQRRQTSSNRRSSRKLDNLSFFFETHSLAILKLLSDVVTEVHCSQILPERRRCLAGIKQMISIGGDHTTSAVPQISACLRSTIANPDLCEEGFSAWSCLVKNMTEMSTFLEPTFALIHRYWGNFNNSTQKEAHNLVSWLVSEKQNLLIDQMIFLPSLGDIDLLSKIAQDVAEGKRQLDCKRSFETFSKRLESEDSVVILRSLEELEIYLEDKQCFLQNSSLAEEPDLVVAQILRTLLDVCVRFSSTDESIAILCAKCLGLIGCLDPNRIDVKCTRREMVVSSNFSARDETVDFVIFFLEEILVKAFLASMNPRSQNFLGYAMQNLLEICNFSAIGLARGLQEGENDSKWMSMSEDTRAVLTPFLNSRYTLLEGNMPAEPIYPIYSTQKKHSDWLRELVYDLLKKADGENASLVFGISKRIVRGQTSSIAAFILPYIALNVLVGEGLGCKHEIAMEFSRVLNQPINGLSQTVKNNLILCSQDVFRTLDYFSRWVHRKKQIMSSKRLPQNDIDQSKLAVQTIESLVDRIPPEVMSRRAVECKNYPRGLFYWEQHIRQWKQYNSKQLQEEPQSVDTLYERLQDIYVKIDEPDCVEGISNFLQLLEVDQQVLEHRKAGRWSAVQDWNEILLNADPTNGDHQSELLLSLRESGQYDALMNSILSHERSGHISLLANHFMVEACWSTSHWRTLLEYVPRHPAERIIGFSNGIGATFAALYEKRYDDFTHFITKLRTEIARSLSKSSTETLQSCREALFYFHALTEIEAICDVKSIVEEPTPSLSLKLDKRLSALGAFSSDKQYLLRIRRAAMQLSKQNFNSRHLSSAWLTSARLYRKQRSMQQAFRAILHASQLGDRTAAIEHARLLWREGNHRRAIQSLEGAIAANALERSATSINTDGVQPFTRTAEAHKQSQDVMAAKAQLLRAKWVDIAGQTQSESIIKMYQDACSLYTRWEKGQYNLGKHYNKILESEKLKTPGKQSQPCISGELAKHVIENYLRSMAYGAKYVYQTLPRILTLWCELGTIVDQNLDSKYGTDESFRNHVMKHRKSFFEATVSQLRKYIDRLPAFVFYTALNQTCARICHSNAKVYSGLAEIVVKVCVAHPQQALWTLLAMVRSTARDRMQRGQSCIAKVQENAKRSKSENSAAEIKVLVTQGSKVTEQLLEVCNADLRKFSKRQTRVSIKDMGFNHRQASPCKLVVPLQTTLTASLPTATETVNMRQHKAFSKETITIHSFEDEVMLLSSLVRPRKVDVRGSDGRIYSLLCKPKDDLRLDQRLLEFNATIKRLLKKDAESSKRRLYVKTYAVTPLNEECGLIEWVEGLKTHRDIMIKIYAAKGISPDYRAINTLLEEAVNEDITKFTVEIGNMFPHVFHEWFIETFPDPEAWFIARLRYTRSCAVMSIVGHVLGLGDRHGENIMIEEGNGGIMHVDFNCLFDKGLTFEKPERVPFRLTGNMVDAFGAYGYEGPFRKACELAMSILRQNEDTLMTILEQFLYDPTIELMGGRKKRSNVDVPSTPEGVLDSVRSKVRGFLPKEAIPLSVEGYVEHMILQSRNPFRLASMYIGWCAFL